MGNRFAVRVLLNELLNTSLWDKTRFVLLPALAGVAMVLAGNALTPTKAMAADVVCAPNSSGTAIASTTETCTGAGDKIKYDTVPATVSSTVTLNGVTITGAAAGTTDAVAINPGATSVVVLTTGGGSITATSGNGINVTTTTGTGTISIGTAANRISIPISGGFGLNTAQGIFVAGRGDVNVFVGNVPIIGTSTGGGSWGIRVADGLAGSNPGGAVVVDTLGTITAARGGILATTSGTDLTDTVTVITAGAITASGGAGIQTSSINGGSNITAGAAIIGSVGAGTSGISETVTGTGTAVLTTLAGASVTGNGGATGILVASGAGGMTINLGANVTSTTSNAIKTTSSNTTGVNVITLGAATVKGLGTSATTAVIDMTAPSGGLTTLNAGGNTVITSNSATIGAQNGDLAIKGTGGSIVFNNAGTLRGITDFSAITVGANNVTINNSGNWFTTGTSNFGAGGSTLSNSGTFSPNGTTTLTGLKTLSNSGTIQLGGNGTTDVLLAPSAAYTSSGAAKLALDVPLGGATQSACAAGGGADCISIGASSGAGTVININDTNTGAAQLNPSGVVLVHATSAAAGNFVLGGSNVVTGQQGAVIPKGFVQYGLTFDSANNNFTLVGRPGSAMMEAGYAKAGLQSAWGASADSWTDRSGELRHANTAQDWSLWVKGFYARLDRDNVQSFSLSGTTSLYDTSYQQSGGGLEAGLDTVITDDNGGSWVVGVLAGYASTRLRFKADDGRETAAIWNVGGYASYFKSGFFADLLLKDDMARVNFVFPTASGLPHINGNAFGVKFTMGTSLDAPDLPAVIEPQASISYVSANLDNLVDPSATFAFGNGDSAIGTIGARIRGSSLLGNQALAPFAFVGINQEFSAANPFSITSGGQTLAWRDHPSRTFGTGSLGFTFHASDTLSGLLAADGLVADGTTGWAVRLGLRQNL
jgi:hypothetical protein